MQFKRDLQRQPSALLRHIVSTPFIYAVFFPLVLLDLFVEIYHRICFPLYHLPYIRRSNYLVFDRAKLPYLNWLEKINCTYCSYAGGFLRYAAAIAEASEQYWCGIAHQRHPEMYQSPHEKMYLPYGDEPAYRKFIEKK